MDKVIRTTSQIDVVSKGWIQQDGDYQLFWNTTTVKMNMEVGKVVMKSPHQQDKISQLRFVSLNNSYDADARIFTHEYSGA